MGRRIFRYLQIDTGPRRSPSACSERLKKKSHARQEHGVQQHEHRVQPDERAVALRERRPLLQRDGGLDDERQDQRVDREHREDGQVLRHLFLKKNISEKISPTASAKGLCGSEGTSRRVSPRPSQRYPPTRSSPSAFAVGVRRKVARNKRAGTSIPWRAAPKDARCAGGGRGP